MNPLFRERLSRAELLSLPPVEEAVSVSVMVHRNHAFELAGSVLDAFLGFSGLRASLRYGDYDDSLSFSVLAEAEEADVHILWLDAARYGRAEEFPVWLETRLRVLRERVSGKILLACYGAGPDFSLPVPGGLFFSVDQAVAPLGEEALDLRLAPLTGARLSGAAMLAAAREIGLRLLPALLQPALKALVLDLDNTLYAGVLGEDGPEGLVPYTALQEHIRELGRQGFLLALASKNEEEDVRELFARRPDFPLRLEDFAACRINWNPKADNIRAIADAFNIAPEAMLFVDDNPGEILRAAQALPSLKTLEAASPEETLRALRLYPGLLKTNLNAEDALRKDDILANRRRRELRDRLTPREYLRELNLELRVEVNPAPQLERVTELLHKTNQFILSFMRPGKEDVARFMAGRGRCVVAASMKDRLSDSGLIAVLLGLEREGRLHVRELAVSCRALGRGIEADMIAAMLHTACRGLNASAPVTFSYSTGKRNMPGLAWLGAVSGAMPGREGEAVAAVLPECDPELDVKYGARLHA